MRSRLLSLLVLSLVMFTGGTVLAGGFSNYHGEAGIIGPQEREPGAIYNFGVRGLPDSNVLVGGEARVIGPNEKPGEDAVMLEVPFGSYWGEAGITGPVDHIRVNP